MAAWLHSHPAILQLQFLPFLYRKPGEKIVVSARPPEEYLSHLKSLGLAIDGIEELSHPTAPFELELWGASKAAAEWAAHHGGSCRENNWDTVKEVHSKLYAFALAPGQIPHSRIVHTLDDAEQWVSDVKGPKVLKQAFGLSGAGHMHCEERLPPKAVQLLEKGTVLIAEPWVQRTLDFSTQWNIGEKVEYLGATLLEVSSKGLYRSTKVGDENALFKDHLGALELHINVCRPLLEKVRRSGFFGNLGVDAFIYEQNNERKLRPVSEINARKTMGWVALQMQRIHFPNKMLHLRYETSSEVGLLPQKLGSTHFPKQLLFSLQ